MSTQPDLVIRGGTIADGSGGDLFEADIAINNGRIAEVGTVADSGKDEIDARGKARCAGLCRHPHPLRRSGHLEPGRHSVLPERGHYGDHG
jgi:N-acyl-D-aspartate/D-glutamate deacylase